MQAENMDSDGQEAAKALLQSAIARRRAGKPRDALAICQSILETKPGNEMARVESSECLRELGELEDAALVLSQGLRIRPHSPCIKCALANVLADQGDMEGAKELLDSAIADAPQSVAAHIAMIRLLVSDGAVDLALEAGNRALGMVKEANSRAIMLMEYSRECGRLFRSHVDVNAKLKPSGRPLHNAVAVSLLKDNGDIIEQQLIHHYQLGFRYFALADNMSTDDTVARVESFRDSHPQVQVIVVSDPIAGFYQNAKTMALVRYAVNYFAIARATIEWIFPLDADEFIWVPEGESDISDIIARAESKTQRILVYLLNNAASESALPELGPFENIQSVFPVRERFARRLVTKVAYKYSDETKNMMGGHFVLNAASDCRQIRHLTRDGVFLAHHPYRSIAQVRSKIVNGGQALKNAPEVQGGGHWRKQFEEYQTKGEGFLRKHLEAYIRSVKASNRIGDLDAVE